MSFASPEHSLSEMTKKREKKEKKKGKINRRRGENPNMSYHTVHEFSIWFNQPRMEKIFE